MAENAQLHLIVGLGNPGDKYRRNRHNVGFMAVEELARRHGLSFNHRQARAEIAKGTINGVPVVLALPQTFMNNSGESVSGLLRWHKLPQERLMIVYDELDLPLGTIRIRERGSTAGHNGMNSISNHLHTQAFPRLRIGIGKPPAGDTIPWVLGNFSKDEQRELDVVLKQAADALESWLNIGIERTMNTYNTTPKEPSAGSRGQRPKTEGRSTREAETQAESQETEERQRPSASRQAELPGLGGQIRELRSRLFGHDGHK